jgi:transposase
LILWWCEAFERRTSYKVRAYPTPEQVVVLNRTFGCVRLVWNKVLAWRQDRHHTQGPKTSHAGIDRYSWSEQSGQGEGGACVP